MKKDSNMEKINIVIVIMAVIAILSIISFLIIVSSYKLPPITTNITLNGDGSNAVIYIMNITFSNYNGGVYLNFTVNKAFETFSNGITTPITNAFAGTYLKDVCLSNEYEHINFIYKGNEYTYSCLDV